jgi:type II secretory pathway pseudopilin PulG
MKRGQWALVLALLLVILAIVGFVAASARSQQRRAAARAALKERVEAAQAAVEARRQSVRPASAVVSTPISPDELDTLLADLDAVAGRQSDWSRLVEEISKTDDPWSPDLLARVQAWLAEHQELVAQARELVARGTSLDLTVMPAADMLPLLQELDEVVRLLTVNAETLAAYGRYSEAAEMVQEALAVAELLGSQHLISAQQRRTVAYHRTLGALAGLMSGHRLSDAQLGELDSELSRAYRRDQIAAVAAGEARVAMAHFDAIRASFFGPLLAPAANRNEAIYIEYLNNVAEQVTRPYYELYDTAPVLPDLPATQSSAREMLQVLQPALLRAMEDQARYEAEVDMARIAIALERHYLETGAYPDSLEPLAAAFDGEPPIDPFTGQPYHYRLTGGAYLLYSLGPNQTDNGGVQGRDGDIVSRGVGESYKQ